MLICEMAKIFMQQEATCCENKRGSVPKKKKVLESVGHTGATRVRGTDEKGCMGRTKKGAWDGRKRVHGTDEKGCMGRTTYEGTVAQFDVTKGQCLRVAGKVVSSFVVG